MPDTGFVPLLEHLRANMRHAAVACEEPPPEAFAETQPAVETPATLPEPCACGDALAQVRRFRAALDDALVAAVSSLCGEIAVDVLARELRIQPADLARIVQRALARCEEADPLCVRAHADDCAELAAAGYPARADAALRRGDLTIELRSGTIDASLGARIESLLAAR